MSIQLIISFLLALVPAGIWAFFMWKGYRNKKSAFFMFFGGILAVVMMAGIQVLGSWMDVFDLGAFALNFTSDEGVVTVLRSIWTVVQEYNPVALIRSGAVGVLMVFVVAGALEEIFKQWLVRRVDRSSLLIKDVNDSIRYSLMAALGFAFAENIYYFYVIWQQLGAEALVAPVIFRTTFTTAAHMCFSGIWGYYYGQGKFCVQIVEQKRWRGQQLWLTRFVAWFSGMPQTQAFREIMIYKGLLVAMIFHGVFNYWLEIGQVLPVMISVVVAFAYLMYLLSRKSGSLTLVEDVDTREISSMAKKDEGAVIEYIGLIYNEGKYQQVIDTCGRLLEKDPTNNVVKLFQAKAIDKQKLTAYISSLVAKKEAQER